MRKQNRGKEFEGCIRQAFENVPNVSFDRLPDPMAGYSGVRNICDFSMFQSPDMFYIECKCLYGNTLNYAGDITKNQWDGMTKKSKISHCVAGIFVWFIDYDITVFVDIIDLNAHKKAGNKSLNIKDITGNDSIPHFILDGIKHRVKFSYFGEPALKKLHDISNRRWGSK